MTSDEGRRGGWWRSPNVLVPVVGLLYEILGYYSAENQPAIAATYLGRIADDLRRNLESAKEYTEALRDGKPWAVQARDGARALLGRSKAKAG